MSRAPLVLLARMLVAVACGMALLALAGCGEGQDVDADAIVVGVGSTVEQEVLAALTVVALEDAGLEAELAVDLGDTVGVRREALRGEVDVHWGYTGAAWALGLRQQDPPADPGESLARVRQEDADRGLRWLEASEADATLALFVRDDAAPEDDRPTLEWLAQEASARERTLCVDPDFRDRPGGLEDLAALHGMDLDRVPVRGMDAEEAVAGVAEGACFAGLAPATSGEAHREGLVRVRDERGVFPAFVVAPVVREATLEEHPRLAEALRSVTTLLDTGTLARLNDQVAEIDDPEEHQELAREELSRAE